MPPTQSNNTNEWQETQNLIEIYVSSSAMPGPVTDAAALLVEIASL